jgi:uncharacterized membrane protein (DUF4010 family)
LENLTKRIPPEEILTFTKFLLLTAVILPVLPNQDLGPFQINPFKTWLVVAAVSTVSYGSYVLQHASKRQGGIILAALLGGAYSSTVTTVALAKRASREKRPHLFAGAMLIASAMMYLRLAVLIALFNRNLIAMLAAPFVVLAAVAAVAGWLWSRLRDASSEEVQREYQPRNPLEFRAAFLFALLFLTVVVVTHFALTYLGKSGIYALASVMGIADVDPFIMSMTQSVNVTPPIAATAILIAAASNNVAKGVYAYCLSDRRTAVQGLGLLVGLAVLGLIPLLWL